MNHGPASLNTFPICFNLLIEINFFMSGETHSSTKPFQHLQNIF